MQTKENTIIFTFRLNSKLHNLLSDEAAKEKRSKAKQIEKILEDYYKNRTLKI